VKRVTGVLLVVVGSAGIVLGLLFIIGSGGKAYRMGIAAACLAVGAVLVGGGIRCYKQAEAASPEQLRADILALAKKRNGELSQSDIAATLGRRAAGASAVLAAMQDEGLCQQRLAQGSAYYVFKGLQPRLLVRRCQHCRTELPVEEQPTECPQCGGKIELDVETRSLSGGDEYCMDD